ncbi:MAG: DUF1289 domain-containing protein [Planctomycetes bacterium]|nr:DUF1289 domain-containing protein [Planctomycetota bacterium]
MKPGPTTDGGAGEGPSPPAAPPLSPCVRICVLDASRRSCTGCGRTVDEIARWWSLSDAEKRAVLARLAAARGC